jgi:HEAT repeat protein
VLTKLKYASRAFLRREFEERDLPADYVLELLRILSRVGSAGCAELAARFLEHGDPVVRIEALDAATALDAAYGEERAVGALTHADPKLREAALKALFDRGSAAPGLFAFCERILDGLDDSNEKTAQLICSRLAGYERGEARERSIALLLMTLGATREESGNWWSSLRRSVRGEPSHASVRVAACQALGRLRAQEAREALTALGEQADPSVRRAALHALELISGSPDASNER